MHLSRANRYAGGSTDSIYRSSKIFIKTPTVDAERSFRSRPSRWTFVLISFICRFFILEKWWVLWNLLKCVVKKKDYFSASCANNIKCVYSSSFLWIINLMDFQTGFVLLAFVLILLIWIDWIDWFELNWLIIIELFSNNKIHFYTYNIANTAGYFWLV